jgi:ATP dependent DNA ligase C terminal region/ATP dependent DNA ligase domain
MKANQLLDWSRMEFKLKDYRVGPAAALTDSRILARVQEYRRLTSARMVPLDRSDIRHKIPRADFFVSPKVDGEFTALIYDEGEAFLVNPGGTVRTGLPVTEEAARLLSRANSPRAMFAGELFVQVDDRRPRVHDVSTVARLPKNDNDLRRLHFAVFDLMPLEACSGGAYAETWNAFNRLFDAGERIRPVETQKASSPDDIEKCFEKWVVKEGAEGVVARSDTGGLFKIKPRHTLDVAVIGFTESTGDREGMLHDLLYAVMRQDGSLQVLSRVGGGFDDDQRRAMLADLKDMIVDSEYVEVNSDHVAYQMVRPEWVIEISCLDLISQTTRGAPVNRAVLDFQNNGRQGYRVIRRMPLATVISPQFIRRREDKSVRPQDIRIEQVASIVEVPLWERDARKMAAPKSEVLRRTVYTKVMKGETMVRKLVLWKTNKETEDDTFPAYVLHFTDFSPSRKTPLTREVRVSSSRDQMAGIWAQLLEENIKKGWELHSSTTEVPESAAATTASSEPARFEEQTSETEIPAKLTKRLAKKQSVTAAEAPGEGMSGGEETVPKRKGGKKKT